MTQPPETNPVMQPTAPVIGRATVEYGLTAAELDQRPVPQAVRVAGAAALTHEGVAEPGRLRRLMTSPEVRAASAATFRLVGNLAISVIDAVPLIGDVFEWAIDASKTFKATDIFTPNVKRRWAWGSEILEGVSLFGIPMPSHLVETGMQFWHDRGVFIPGIRAATAIIRSRDVKR